MATGTATLQVAYGTVTCSALAIASSATQGSVSIGGTVRDTKEKFSDIFVFIVDTSFCIVLGPLVPLQAVPCKTASVQIDGTTYLQFSFSSPLSVAAGKTATVTLGSSGV